MCGLVFIHGHTACSYVSQVAQRVRSPFGARLTGTYSVATSYELSITDSTAHRYSGHVSPISNSTFPSRCHCEPGLDWSS
jgi:hypothetical protein